MKASVCVWVGVGGDHGRGYSWKTKTKTVSIKQEKEILMKAWMGSDNNWSCERFKKDCEPEVRRMCKSRDENRTDSSPLGGLVHLPLSHQASGDIY